LLIETQKGVEPFGPKIEKTGNRAVNALDRMIEAVQQELWESQYTAMRMRWPDYVILEAAKRIKRETRTALLAEVETL